MPELYPFQAIRPQVEIAQQTILGPDFVYDLYNRKVIHGINQFSFMHVLSAAAPDSTKNGINKAAAAVMNDFLERGLFQQDKKACLYIYQTNFKGNLQTGIIGLSKCADYMKGHIKTHENTRKSRETQLLNFVESLGINTTPVQLTYKQDPAIDKWVFNQTKGISLYSLKHPEGLNVEIWAVSDSDAIAEVQHHFMKISDFYIADGHHRAKTAANLFLKHDRMDKFLTILIPSNQLVVYPFVRIIKKDKGVTFTNTLEQLKKYFNLKEVNKDQMFHQFLPSQQFIICGKNKSFMLSPKSPIHSNDTLSQLDVSILQDYILNPYCGITDPTTDPGIAFHTKNITLDSFNQMLDATDVEMIFICRAPSVEDMFRIADEHKIMPPKSTSFEPKILSGLLMQKLG